MHFEEDQGMDTESKDKGKAKAKTAQSELSDLANRQKAMAEALIDKHNVERANAMEKADLEEVKTSRVEILKNYNIARYGLAHAEYQLEMAEANFDNFHIANFILAKEKAETDYEKAAAELNNYDINSPIQKFTDARAVLLYHLKKLIDFKYGDPQPDGSNFQDYYYLLELSHHLKNYKSTVEGLKNNGIDTTDLDKIDCITRRGEIYALDKVVIVVRYVDTNNIKFIRLNDFHLFTTHSDLDEGITSTYDFEQEIEYIKTGNLVIDKTFCVR